jgi:O-antigen/teichoic acid export membrane protein
MNRAHIDRPVFFGMLSRAFGLITAPITGVLIASIFTSKLQGYYYTFVSLSAVQTFVELGLTIVIVQFAAHEWSFLRLDNSGNIIGNNVALSRLTSLTRFILKWYGIAAILLFVGLCITGNLIFSKSQDPLISWKLPWYSYCILTSITFLTLPIGSLLEGCNQVSNWYTFQFYQLLVNRITFWIVILLHANLWSLTFTSIASLICFTFFIIRKYRFFLKTLIYSHKVKEKISWFAEIWPMQWKIALSCLSGYFVFYFFIPVLFRYHGAVVAGQMGLTWSAVGLIPSISSAWVMPKVPQLGMLIAKKKHDDLDRLFWRLIKITILVSSFTSLAGWLIVYALNVLHHPFAQRLLPPLPVGIFAFAQILLAISQPMSAYMRAHKEEPILVLSIISGVLICVSNLTLGKWYSAMGMAVGYLLVTLIIFPLIYLTWLKYKNEKHPSKVISSDEVSMISCSRYL